MSSRLGREELPLNAAPWFPSWIWVVGVEKDEGSSEPSELFLLCPMSDRRKTDDLVRWWVGRCGEGAGALWRSATAGMVATSRSETGESSSRAVR